VPQNINILLVDDVDYSRELLKSAIKASINDNSVPLEPQFFTTSKGKEVLNIIEQKHIQLVYLDIELPDISGLDILKSIKKQFKRTMVVMVSGESSSANVMDAIKSGASGFIVKPFNSNRINDSLQKYLKEGIKL
jgi:two-component system, chemotaxis family, chemotaxis protein CheY